MGRAAMRTRALAAVCYRFRKCSIVLRVELPTVCGYAGLGQGEQVSILPFFHRAMPHNLHAFDCAGGIPVCSPDGELRSGRDLSEFVALNLFRVKTCQHPVWLRSPLVCLRLLLEHAPSSIVPIHVTTPSIAPLRTLATSQFC